ncbi:MAG TPA: L,D-transpeptidase family protein [Dissulfurispiraceae bacterium]|nr:L,D-transpeptidase family protein [Dissulfurispiraceae bacterium]
MKIQWILNIALVVVTLATVASQCAAQTFSYDQQTSVVGAPKVYATYVAGKNDSLIELARQNHLGYNEITLANPALDPFVPGEGAAIRIPAAWVLPDSPYDGIVINLSEMRLYFFHPVKKVDQFKVSTFPIGIGDEGLDTPVGSFKIVERMANPAWYPPKSIREERPELPAVVPPGPDNPLGTHALRLSLRTYLLHGTNRPYAIGRRATHGCIRLYPEEVPKLYEMVPVGTKVTIVKQPIKVGVRNKRVFVEIHEDPDVKISSYFEETTSLLKKMGLMKNVSTEKLYKAVRKKDGMPTDISLDETKGPKAPVVVPEFWTL